ncbi:MAG: hypothetical protein OEX04_12960 [Acidimicrobiia bacterium]|nr:hypothetical protein [Acidimicrobiia bacterium]MDH4308379.1 hypothetical protein [Acidimicrobiia bacterium]MDH5293218.1 hypothetical protein [Acidimicrobiia bacterium]
MLVDRHGFRLGTEVAEAADAYNAGLDRFLALSGGADTLLEQATRVDPDFGLAWATLAAWRHFGGDHEAARTALSHATGAAMSPREQSYVGLLSTAFLASVSPALDAAGTHLERYPQDVLAFEQVMLASHFGGGGLEDRRRALSMFAAARGEVVDDWAFLGVSAFVHQEAGLFDEAERLGRRSLSLRPDNADAMHSVAHVHYERGAHEEGSSELDSWMGLHDDHGPFHIHFTWHLALHDLGLGEWERSLDRYRATISPTVGGPGTMSDAPTLLWRLMLRGFDPSRLPWDELVEVAGPMAATPTFRYGDWHVAFALAGGRSDAGLAELEAALTERGDGRPQAPTMVRVVRGIRAYANGEFESAAQLLDVPDDDIPFLGGSRAQREVVEDTVIDAMVKAGNGRRARELLEQRLSRRPSRDDLRLAEGL